MPEQVTLHVLSVQHLLGLLSNQQLNLVDAGVVFLVVPAMLLPLGHIRVDSVQILVHRVFQLNEFVS